jgi:LuxR family maltose regulon positive regulatory protein
MTRIPFVADGVLQVAGGREEAAEVVVGTPAWFAWLADDSVRSFSFRSRAGGYTARKERRQRGGGYWVAYRTAAGHQYKKYLVPWKGSSLTLGDVQVRASQGRRGRNTGSYADRGERREVRAWAPPSVKRFPFQGTRSGS